MTQFSTDIQLVIQRMEKKFGEVERTIARLGDSVSQAVGTNATPSIQNLIDNGEVEFSKDAYTNTPLAGGDIGFEAYNWYRQTEVTTLLAESAANALKYTGHSLYAANEGVNGNLPRWERVNGWIEFGSTATAYDIACPLPINFVRGGVSYIIQFIHKLSSGTWPADVEVAAMFYDNTAGQEKIIVGGPFTITYSVSTVGATALEYKIIGQTDYGEEIESNVLSVPDAPAILTVSNYVQLGWTGAAGYINFNVYKKVGSTYYLQGVVSNGGTSYRDQGDAPLATVVGYPTVTTTAARAYTETNAFVPTSAWTRISPDLIIRVPATYDTSLTTGRQWLRLRITGPTSVARQLLIDRIGVSTGFGGWARSNNDLMAANRNPSTSASLSEQGDIGIQFPQGPGGIQL